MNEKSKNGKAETKQTRAKRDASKTLDPKAQTSNSGGDAKPLEKTNNSGELATKNDPPKSISQSSISYFSSVSTPEYRAGWDKIFGKSKTGEAPVVETTDYDHYKALVSAEWRNYQQNKDPEHLAKICKELPFFDHREVGEEIARLLLKQ